MQKAIDLKPGNGKSLIAQIVKQRLMTPKQFWKFIDGYIIGGQKP